MRTIAVCCLLIVALALGCSTQEVKNADMKQPAKRQSMDLPIISPWQSTVCQLLNVDGKEIAVVEGVQATYGPDPDPFVRKEFGHPITVTAFVTPTAAWIGPECDVYLQSSEGIIGLKLDVPGVSWMSGFAPPETQQTLAQITEGFEHNISGEELWLQYRRAMMEHSPAGTRDTRTFWDSVIPMEYVRDLTADEPGSSGHGKVKYLSAEMDGALIKLVVANNTDEVTPTIWIDPKTKVAVRAENYKFSRRQDSLVVVQTKLKWPAMLMRVYARWSPAFCTVLKTESGKKSRIEGKRIIYGPDPMKPEKHDVTITVTAFVSPDGVWVGPQSDVYLQGPDGIVGLKVGRDGISWFDGFATATENQTLDQVIDQFQMKVSESELRQQYRAALMIGGAEGSAETRTRWDSVKSVGDSLPVGGVDKLVDADMDGRLVKITVSSDVSGSTATLWIDPRTRIAVKAERNASRKPDADRRQKAE
ncbi:MAG TPA: hypothetical protein PK992_14150 [Planctomycetaceae bacterium]|nr:hypothetical protein [Planctomycetaceae bacterium]HRA89221.1 hypothetical protein [Planctomycetaceae bacterium]